MRAKYRQRQKSGNPDPSYKKAYDTGGKRRSRRIHVDNMIPERYTKTRWPLISIKTTPSASALAYCRHAAMLVDEDTHDMPMDVCMWFGNMAEYAIERLGARQMTKHEARQVLRSGRGSRPGSHEPQYDRRYRLHLQLRPLAL